jgi:hypothetical protein
LAGTEDGKFTAGFVLNTGYRLTGSGDFMMRIDYVSLNTG